ncbi:MAG: MlaD family protein [Prevotella sp.]|nr:MlaD family protein [Prevotella sp.]
MKRYSKEIKIALVAICGLVILYFGMSFLKGLNLFSSANTYLISFKDISGLASSSPIYADGYKVGVVDDIQFNYDNPEYITVEVDIDKQLRIPKGSSAEIVSDMLGNVRVNLVLANDTDEQLKPGETIQGAVQGGALGKLGDMVPYVESMLPKLDSILYSLNLLLADPALAQSLHNVQNITSDLTVTTNSLNTMLAELNKNVPGMMEKANGVLDNANTLTANLSTIDVAGTVAKADATLANVAEFTAQLNNKQGTMGLLMRDPSLYNNLTSTMSSADSLLIDLRAHPKRYVHFSLFGKKDK